MTNMREAQQAWDNAQPPDTSRQEREHEEACKSALAHYLKTGNLPGREDASHVWEDMGYDVGSELILLNMLEAYCSNNDTLLLALARAVAARVESIVNEKIEDAV